jgi:hypothetical protein
VGSSLNKFASWGGPPGLRPTPSSALFRAFELVRGEPDQGVRRGRGVRPTKIYVANFQLRTLGSDYWPAIRRINSHVPITSSRVRLVSLTLTSFLPISGWKLLANLIPYGGLT